MFSHIMVGCSDLGRAERFYVTMPQDRGAAGPGNGSMVAFLAASAPQVRESYLAGMAAGGADAGPPGPRPAYGDGYFGAYIRDPDGNKVHLVHRGDL